jgi:uncharacterized protein
MIDIVHLIWDEWNVAHIARHNVTPQEVEDVCHNEPTENEGYQHRMLLIGSTHNGRMLSLVLAPQGEGVYYPVTARDASRKERRLYQLKKEGEAA